MRHWIGKLVQISIYNISNAFNNRLSTRRALFEHCTTSSNIDEYILLTYLLNIDLSSSSSQFWAELCQAAAAITNTASSLPTVDLGQARPTTPRPLHRAPPPAPASIKLCPTQFITLPAQSERYVRAKSLSADNNSCFLLCKNTSDCACVDLSCA